MEAFSYVQCLPARFCSFSYVQCVQEFSLFIYNAVPFHSCSPRFSSFPFTMLFNTFSFPIHYAFLMRFNDFCSFTMLFNSVSLCQCCSPTFFVSFTLLFNNFFSFTRLFNTFQYFSFTKLSNTFVFNIFVFMYNVVHHFV